MENALNTLILSLSLYYSLCVIGTSTKLFKRISNRQHICVQNVCMCGLMRLSAREKRTERDGVRKSVCVCGCAVRLSLRVYMRAHHVSHRFKARFKITYWAKHIDLNSFDYLLLALLSHSTPSEWLSHTHTCTLF